MITEEFLCQGLQVSLGTQRRCLEKYHTALQRLVTISGADGMLIQRSESLRGVRPLLLHLSSQIPNVSVPRSLI